MARLTKKLTDIRCKTSPIGTHSDGGGLYLQVRPGTSGPTRAWVYRYSVNGKQVWLGLGPYPVITLPAARERALGAARLRPDGHDPLQQKRAVRASLSHQQARNITFGESADAHVKSHRAGWRSVRHAMNWARSLELYVTPVLGGLSVSVIDTTLVMKVLEPMW